MRDVIERDILPKLRGVKSTARDNWQARCPGHEDGTASLSIKATADKVLLHCHAGCAARTVCGALGLKMKDLFMPKPAKCRRHVVKTYDYRDDHAELLYQVLRYEPKDFRQRRPDGKGGWVWKLGGVERVPYNLPELLNAAEDRPEH